jgi:RNA polymerase sigma factor (sigma-70 family)
MCTAPGERSSGFAAFVVQRQAALLAECLSLTGSYQNALDLLQEVLLGLWQDRGFDPCHPRAPAYAKQRARWLFLSDKRTRRPSCFPTTSAEGPDDAGAVDPADPDVIEPWLLLALEEDREQLHAALQQLDKALQDILNMRLAGLTFRDISATLGGSIGTVTSRYYRALTQLRDVLGDDPLPQ